MFYDLAASNWGVEETKAIGRVVDSDRFTSGPEVKHFEQEFAAYHGRQFGVMVNSGSSANLVAVASLFFRKNNPLQRGDEVIVPALSWATAYHPLQQYGLKLRIVDIDLNTLNIDVSQLEVALTPKTRMIVAINILGNPAALDVMREFADEHELYLFEDNCESLDAELLGQKTGTFGDISTASFFFSHHIATMEGGMAITDDEELAHLMISLRAHGWTRDLPETSPIFKRQDSDHYEAYRFILPGYNVRPIEMSGAIGREQLKKLPAMTTVRRKNLKLFQEHFGNDERFIIQQENGKSSSFCFPIILNPDAKLDKSRIFKALSDNDIEFRMITGGCILRHDVKQYYDYNVVGDIQNAEIAHDYGFFVGNYPDDLTVKLNKLREVINDATR